GPNAAQIIGYDQHLETPGGRAEAVAEAAERFLDNASHEPFFLDVGFMETHTLPGDSLFGCEPGDARYAGPPAPLPDTPRTRQDIADFKVAAARLDAAIGRVLDALERNGLAENTLVISTTDHGLPLPGMKGTLTDHGLGVSLILRGPEYFGGGKVCDAMVSHIDLFPTLCDWLQVEAPPWLQGRSLLPLLRGEVEAVNEQIFAEVTHHAAYQPQRAVRTQRWKYIRQFEARTKPVLPNVDDSRSKDVWVESGWRERTVAPEALFDLLFDPNESHNLADDAAHAAVLQEMRGRLDTWMHATGDPLLHGPVPLPPGAPEKSPDDLSPQG
ncbi:MAG: N-sulfoglucosamine sulfohydrolase, partial [Abditibacteriota bacterium]|nr:N-sulfoglucosamine sulfohydrolase [Abditibacteriota bacterium]